MTTDDQIHATVGQLAQSSRGLEALGVLNRWLVVGGGLGLDAQNKSAVLALLGAAFGPRPSLVLDLLAEHSQERAEE